MVSITLPDFFHFDYKGFREVRKIYFVREPKLVIFVASGTTSSRSIPQVRKEARVGGRSGAMPLIFLSFSYTSPFFLLILV